MTFEQRIESVERQMGEFRTEVRTEFAAVRVEIRDGDEETRRQMRILYEDLIDRIKMIGEGIDDLRRR